VKLSSDDLPMFYGDAFARLADEVRATAAVVAAAEVMLD